MPQNTQLGISKIIATAWTDLTFRKKLKTDPVKIFEEFGIEIQSGKEIRVLEDSDDVIHIVIPQSPDLGIYTESNLGETGLATAPKPDGPTSSGPGSNPTAPNCQSGPTPHCQACGPGIIEQ